MMGKSNALRVASRRKYLHREAFVMVVYCPATPALGLDTVAGMHSGINFKTDKIPMAVFTSSASSADARVEGATELEGGRRERGMTDIDGRP